METDVKEHLTVVTRKGQITVPVEVRRALGLKVGDKVAVVLGDQEARLRRSGSVVQRTAGALKSDRVPRSAEELREAFETGVAEAVVRRMDE
jgi:AbrB family looped-hinge helix DNA binding protein